MSEANIEVQSNVQTASTEQEVESNVSTASEIQSEDLLAVLDAKDAELEKLRIERENYRKLGLKYKKADELDEEANSDSPDIKTLINQAVEEKLLSSREVQLQREKDEAIKALGKRNRELETALKNRSQISSGSAQGTSTDTVMPVSDKILSQDQIKSLKLKGWDDSKIELFKKNLMKNK